MWYNRGMATFFCVNCGERMCNSSNDNLFENYLIIPYLDMVMSGWAIYSLYPGRERNSSSVIENDFTYSATPVSVGIV